MRRFSKGPNTLFEYRAGMDIADLGGIHTRADASTCASYKNGQGTLKYAAANVVRDGHFVGGSRYLLLETSRRNEMLRSQELENAAWTKQGSTISANVTTAPDGTETADKIVETATTDAHNVSQVSATAPADNAVVALSAFVRISDSRQWTQLVLRRKDNTFARCWFNLSTKTVGTKEAGLERAGIETDWAGGWVRVWVTGNVLTGATTVAGYVTVSTGDGVDVYAGNTANGLYVWGIQLEIGKFPTSYIPTVASTVTRASDLLYFNYSHVPQELTTYCKFIDLGSGIATDFPGVWGMGLAVPRLMLYNNQTGGGGFGVNHHNGTTTVEASGPANAAFSNIVEARSVLAANGSVTIGQVTNGAAETVGGPTGAAALAGAWSQTRLYVGTNGSTPGAVGIEALIVVKGTQSMATMQYDYFTAMAAESAEFVHLLEFTFSSGTVRLSTGAQDLSWNSQMWEAVGGLLSFGGVEETNDMRSQGVEVSISGVDQTVLSSLLNNSYRGRTVKIYRAHLNRSTGKLVGDPLLLFQGLQVSPYNVEEERSSRSGGTVKISTRVVGLLGVPRQRGIQASLASHQHYFNGDVFFQHVSNLANRKIYWGTATATGIGGRRGANTDKGPFK